MLDNGDIRVCYLDSGGIILSAKNVLILKYNSYKNIFIVLRDLSNMAWNTSRDGTSGH